MNTARDYPSAPAGLAKRTPPPGTLSRLCGASLTPPSGGVALNVDALTVSQSRLREGRGRTVGYDARERECTPRVLTNCAALCNFVGAGRRISWLLCKVQPKGTVIVGSASFLARHRRHAQQSLGAGRRIQ